MEESGLQRLAHRNQWSGRPHGAAEGVVDFFTKQEVELPAHGYRLEAEGIIGKAVVTNQEVELSAHWYNLRPRKGRNVTGELS